MAKPGTGQAKGHVNKPAKPKPEKTKPVPKPKKSKAGVSGGGAVAGGEFSAQARQRAVPKGKGHFNYTATDGSFKLRCKGVQSYTRDSEVPAVATVVFKDCTTTTGTEPTQVREKVAPVSVTFTDRGQPSEAPGAVWDSVSFTIGATYGGDLTSGNIKIRS